LKSLLNKNNLPIELLTSYAERKFGANGFYGIPTATKQYEATQASLVGLTTVIKNGNLTLKPRLYWRRNQDEYHYIRSNPSIYRNLHITNKFAAECNGSYESKVGISGFGLEVAKYYIASNRLGDNSREMASLFLEHRFQFFNNKFDVTPGIAISYFSDFDNKAFPGLDLGYQIIVIEIDENQHADYDCSCENKRLMELSQDLGHRPVIFIRFNPDEYMNKESGKVTSCWGYTKMGISAIKKNTSKRMDTETRITSTTNIILVLSGKRNQ
jgi:hypothetical protein